MGTKYFHSGTSPMLRGLGLHESESEIFIDPDYLGLGINPFSISGGILDIAVRPASPKRRRRSTPHGRPRRAGQKGRYGLPPACLSSETSFRQLYGYFEVRAKVPAMMGGWPAFWLHGPPGNL